LKVMPTIVEETPATNGDVPPPPRIYNGTYPYDGGPAVPVPLPKGGPDANSGSPGVKTFDTRSVAIQAKPLKYAYLAYGEKANPEPASNRAVVFEKARQDSK
jgi:hypothetical protein